MESRSKWIDKERERERVPRRGHSKCKDSWKKLKISKWGKKYRKSQRAGSKLSWSAPWDEEESKGPMVGNAAGFASTVSVCAGCPAVMTTRNPFTSQGTQSGVQVIWSFYLAFGFYSKCTEKPGAGIFKLEKDKLNLLKERCKYLWKLSNVFPCL